METFILDKDITVFYVEASSFPKGVMEAHKKLHSLVTATPNRKFFGLSRPEHGGNITYRAAAEELTPNEGKKLGCDTIIIKQGKYIAMTIHNFMSNTSAIGNAFQEILSTPNLDPQGYCVEWYLNETDVMCMVRIIV